MRSMIWQSRSLRRSELIWPPDMSPGSFPSWGARRCRRSRLVQPAGRSASAQQAARSAWTRGSGKRMPGTRVQVVLLTALGFLAGQVEVGAGAAGDDLGAEGPGGAELAALADGPAEDDVHLVRAADARGCRGSAARRRSARSPAGPGPRWWRIRSA